MANEKRLISLDMACSMLNRFFCNAPTHAEKSAILEVKQALLEMATTEVVHGRWLSAYEYYIKLGVTDKEKLEDAKKDKWWKFCNGCGQAVKGLHNYCPNCGAKMDKEA